MSKQKKSQPASSPSSSPLTAFAKARSSPPTRQKSKRHKVSVGDIVLLHSPFIHATGTSGLVTHVIDDKRVIVRGFPGDDDFTGAEYLALTRRPDGNTAGGSRKIYYRVWIKKVVQRATPLPGTARPAKPTKPTKVIEGRDALLAELASPDPVGASHLVIVPDSEETP